jgi:hypothetical protein
MRQFIASAALAAALFLAPGASQGITQTQTGQAAAAAAPAAPAPAVEVAPAAPYGLPDGHDHGQVSGLAPGQGAAEFRAWLGRSAANRAAIDAFQGRLAAEGVADVVPLWQLVRTSSSWRECGAEPFEVAPADKWEHIVTTLRFVRDKVKPAVGEVEALSAYRNERLNACSAGAPRSAHRQFFALDVTPVNAAVTRREMIQGVCRAHAQGGRAYDAGLGFYSGRRFHVDSSGYRKWGPDGRGASSPCATGIA